MSHETGPTENVPPGDAAGEKPPQSAPVAEVALAEEAMSLVGGAVVALVLAAMAVRCAWAGAAFPTVLYAALAAVATYVVGEAASGVLRVSAELPRGTR